MTTPAPIDPRLKHLPSHSYGDRNTGNMIIQGNNIQALDALLGSFKRQIRCVYVDPPYNNQESYTHYKDRLDHTTWLRQTSRCIELLGQFLRADGSLWISIDDRELHYLKVAVDAILGRANFVSTIVWQHRLTRENRKVFSANHEYILVYAKDARVFKASRNRLPLDPRILERYKNPDNDPRGPWQSVSANVQAGHGTAGQFYEIVAPTGRRHRPPNGRCWIYTQSRMNREISKGNVWFGQEGNGVPRIKRFLADAGCDGTTPHTLWSADEVGTTEAAKKHILQLFPDHPVFDTPKPESLVSRIIQISSRPGDIVLDAYLGSGTTAAVAHKLNRRYIGIEVGQHAVTHAMSRLTQVVDGEQGGVSKLLGWRGGGGFDFYRCVDDAPGNASGAG